MRTYGTSETFNVTPSRIVNIIMLNMLVGMKDSNVKYVINDLAASQDKKKILCFLRADWRTKTPKRNHVGHKPTNDIVS